MIKENNKVLQNTHQDQKSTSVLDHWRDALLVLK